MTAGTGFTDQLNSLGTLGQIGLGLTAFSTAMSIGSAYFTSKTQKAVLDGQARLNMINSQMAELSASQVIEAGVKKREAYSIQAGSTKSKTKTAFASRGFLLSGSMSDVLASQDYVSEVEKLNMERDALNQAFGLKTKSLNDRAQAIGQKFTAESISPLSTTLGATAKSGSDLFSQYALIKSLGK